MAIWNEEIFGPVSCVTTLSKDDEAITLANSTPYGLAAYLYSGDLARALALTERLDFGMVGINRGIMADPAAPFGGVKASGLGREGGHDGIYEFMERKYIALTVNEKAGLL
jgi:succinate-semialdehyde dehydrogenase/glutarate-semialdehyde dehydrogenase